MTAPDDVTGNYVSIMRERGWSWDDLAADFERQAEQPALDGGQSARGMARWARSNAEAGQLRAEQDGEATPEDGGPRPDDAVPTPPLRTAVPPEKRRS